MSIRSLSVVAVICLFTGVTQAEESHVPKFFQETLPPAAIDGLLTGWAAMSSKDAPLDPKTTQLISLAVAAQIPCDYCVYAHAAHALKLGATKEELKHAVGVAGYVRLFSTSLNGMGYSFEKFSAEWDKILTAME